MLINGIDTKDISVVVQGAVNAVNTKNCLESIRKHLPGAEIILSTWEGSNVEGLDFDILVLNKDPGAFPCDDVDNSILNNVNRQIISTQKGLELVKREYAVKLRTDFYLISAEFTSYFDKFNIRCKEHTFLQKRVLCCNIYSRNPRKKHGDINLAYAPSDFFFFGLSTDLKCLFNIDLIEGDQDFFYFEIFPEQKEELRYKSAMCRYMPEQYIWMRFLQKYIKNLNCQHRDDINDENIILTEKTFVANLVLLTKEMLGIETSKKDLFTKGQPENCFTYKEWLALYQKYALQKKSKYILYLLGLKFLKCKNQKQIVTNNINKDYISINNLEKVIDVAKEYKVISFDIFDTLLFRNVEPTWIPTSQLGLYLTMLVKQYTNDIDVEGINRYRDILINKIYKENEARGLDREYLLDDIVEKLLEFALVPTEKIPELKSKIIENEIIRETKCLYLNNHIKQLLSTLKLQNKKIIAISDMYLSEQSIKRILGNFGLADYFDEVYVSSKYKKVKYTGKLFEQILRENDFSNNCMLHIGDNYQSDFIGAKKNNIKAIHYINEDNNNRKENLEKVYKNSEIHTKYFTKILEETKYSKQQIYFRHFAFDFINFSKKILVDCYLHNIECVYFLERDGNLFKNICDELIKKEILYKGLKPIKLKLLKLSRKHTATLIDLNNVYKVINRAYRVNPPNSFNIRHIIGCYGLELEDFGEDLRKKIIENNTVESYFLEIYHSHVKPLIEDKRKQVYKYLNENEFFDWKEVAIADIGWGGTSQRDLAEFIDNSYNNISLTGFYYACDSRIYELNGKYIMYHNAEKLLYGYSLIEFLVKAYTKNEEELQVRINEKSFLEKTYKLNWDFRNLVINTIDEYVKVIEKNCLFVNDIYTYTSKYVQKNIQEPTLSFIKLFEGVYFSLDRKKNDLYIPLYQDSDLEMQYKNAQWVQASIIIKKINNINIISKIKRYLKKFNKLIKCFLIMVCHPRSTFNIILQYMKLALLKILEDLNK